MHSLDLLLKAVKCREEGPPRQIQKTRIEIEIIDIILTCCSMTPGKALKIFSNHNPWWNWTLVETTLVEAMSVEAMLVEITSVETTSLETTSLETTSVETMLVATK